MTPKELLEKIKLDNQDKVDLSPLISELQYVASNAMNSHDLLNWSMGTETRQLRFTESSRKRFMRDLGGPAPFLCERCDESLREDNMTFLIGDYAETHEKFFVRCRNRGGQTLEDLVIRAVLSEDYIPFDNYEFASSFTGPMEDHNMEVASVILENDSMQIKSFFKDTIKANGKRLNLGIMAINSETGKSKPTVECIVENTVDSQLIRWPVDGGALMSVSRGDIQKADLAMQLERIPSVALAEADEIQAAITRAASVEFPGDIVLQLHLLLFGSKIQDNGELLQEMVTHVEHYTNYRKRKVKRIDLIDAVARTAYSTNKVKLARLAGEMLTKEQIWNVALIKAKTDKTEDEDEE